MLLRLGKLPLIGLHVCLCAICEIACWSGVRLPLGVAECLNLARVYASSGRGHKISHLVNGVEWPCSCFPMKFNNQESQLWWQASLWSRGFRMVGFWWQLVVEIGVCYGSPVGGRAGLWLWSVVVLASLHSSKVGPWLSLSDDCPVRRLRKKLHWFLFSKASKYMV